MRIATILAVALSVGTCLADPQHAQAAMQHYQLDIPRQSLDAALKDLAQQTRLQIGRFSERIDGGAIVGPVQGDQTPEDALKTLLEPTGLAYKIVSDTTIAVYDPKTVGSSGRLNRKGPSTGKSPSCFGISSNKRDSVTALNQTGSDAASDCTGEYSLKSQVLASVIASEAGGPVQNSDGESNLEKESTKGTKLEEIIVTAQKRSENLMDVPSSIGVLSGEQLESLQSYSLTDLAGYVPGLTVAGGGSPGSNVLVIRGVTIGAGSSGATVATYIDDVPIGSSIAASTRGNLFGLDLMPYDIDRIEVLRGPQGTLYGADAMGGLIKYALRKPDLTAFKAQAGGDIEDIAGSGGVTWGTRAFVNAPVITDTLGVRASGFSQDNAGYLDNVGTGTQHANHSTQTGGRATALWKANDDLSVQATVLGQNVDTADVGGVALDPVTLKPIYGPRAFSTAFPRPFKQQLRDYSLSVNWDVHFATLTNTASWSRLRSTNQADLTPSLGGFLPYPGGTLVKFDFIDTVSKLTEEMRLTSPEDRKIEWMLGGFFTRENGEEDDNAPTYTPSYVPLPAADNLLISTTTSDFKERALFGNAVYKLSEKFDVGGGARYTQNAQTFCNPVSSGIFGAAGPQPCYSNPYVGNATWMADARFHLDRDSMFYIRWATGYRPGGCNNSCVTSIPLEIPGTFGVDKLANYEGGFKGEFFDHRLQLDLSVFYIDWRDIQLGIMNSLGLFYTGNGGKATSTGFELTTPYQITDRLLLTPSLDYTNAHLTEDAPGIGGKAGDQLPLVPRWSASLLAEYRQSFGESRQFVVGAGYRYMDTFRADFVGCTPDSTSVCQRPRGFAGAFVGPLAPQSIVDLYTALVVDRVSARLYAKNVFNHQQSVHSYAGAGTTGPAGAPPVIVGVQPRTIGLAVDYRFK